MSTDPHRPLRRAASRLVSFALGAPLVFGATFSLGCARSTSGEGPSVDPAHAGDAEGLPDFEAEESSEDDDRFYVEVGDAPVRGRADAPVTVVMFTDFQCPFCKRGHDMLEELAERYEDKLRIVYKAFPLDTHPEALTAAMAVRSAQDQGKFWTYHDRLYHVKDLGPERLLAEAQALGLDAGVIAQDLQALKYGPAVRRDIRQGRRLGVTSTPTFFVNGRPVTGAQPAEIFDEIVQEELRAAGALTQSGVAPSDVYEKLVADGYRKVEYREGRRGLDPDGVFAVPLGDSPSLGPDDAPVTIVIFGDFECPFCSRGHETLRRLRELYPDKLRLVYKHQPLPFHSHAFLAARASMIAHSQGKFWEFHDALYAKQARFDKDTLIEIAKEIGLDAKAFEKALGSTQYDAQVEADQSVAAALGVTGTPAYFINGRPVEGAAPELHFRLIIQEELERAADALASGVAPRDLYEKLSTQPL